MSLSSFKPMQPDVDKRPRRCTHDVSAMSRDCYDRRHKCKTMLSSHLYATVQRPYKTHVSTITRMLNGTNNNLYESLVSILFCVCISVSLAARTHIFMHVCVHLCRHLLTYLFSHLLSAAYKLTSRHIGYACTLVDETDKISHGSPYVLFSTKY